MTHRIEHVKASLSATSPLHIPCRFACACYSGVTESRYRLRASALNKDEAMISVNMALVFSISSSILLRRLTKLWVAEIFLGRGFESSGHKKRNISFALETVLRLPESANFWKWAPEWKVLFLSKLHLFKKGHLLCMCIALLGKGSMCTSVATTSNVCAANCAKIGIASPKICICCVNTICCIRRGLYLTAWHARFGVFGHDWGSVWAHTIFTPSPCEQSSFENNKLFPFLVPMVSCKCGPSRRLE